MNKNIDLSDIKEKDFDKTSSFTDLMTRTERKSHALEKESRCSEKTDDIEDMLEERKRNTKDLTIELKNVKKKINENKNENTKNEVSKTQILDITRQMKFNFEELRKENSQKTKKEVSTLNIVGEINLLCIGYYIYLLMFTNYHNEELSYLITGSFIIMLVLIYGFSIITSKKLHKFFTVLNILLVIVFILFNIYMLI